MTLNESWGAQNPDAALKSPYLRRLQQHRSWECTSYQP